VPSLPSARTENAGLGWRRTAATLAGVVFAYFAWQQTATLYYARVSPQGAPVSIKAMPSIALDRIEASVAEGNTSAPELSVIRALAVESLRTRPIDAVAVRNLGGLTSLDLQAQRNQASLNLSEKISRRDRQTQFGQMLEAARADDIARAMTHLDRLFTVRPNLLKETLPQLDAMLGLKEGQRAFAQRADRPWFPSFLAMAATASADPVPVADLLIAINEPSFDIERVAPGRLAGRLALLGDFPRAVKVAQKAGIAKEVFDKFSPYDANTDQRFAPLSWGLANSGDGAVTLYEEGRIGIDLSAGRRITALERVTRLDPGAYRLEVMAREGEGADFLWRWQMQCFSQSSWQDGWASDLISSERDREEFAFVISAQNCPLQRWILTVRSGDAQGDVQGEMGLRLSSSY
jgi:hypothetical protein